MKTRFALVLPLLVLAACGSKPPAPAPTTTPSSVPRPSGVPMFDQESLERNVRRILVERYDQRVETVSCPAEQQVVVGRSFECRINVAGEQRSVRITVRTEDGQFEVQQSP